jgi:hypothetical protein
MSTTKAPAPEQIATKTTQLSGVDVARIVRHWRVTVAVEGEEILTIESECLSGIENVTDFRKEIIEAAENLLAFIGTGKESSFDFEDTPNS